MVSSTTPVAIAGTPLTFRADPGCPTPYNWPSRSRSNAGAHMFWRQHYAYLLESAGAEDPGLRADVLLGAMAAEQVRHWLDAGLVASDISTAVQGVATALAGSAGKR